MTVNKWIDALLSKKYVQNKGSLRSRDGQSYCVIGVLCDIIDPFGWKLVGNKSSEINHVNFQIDWHDCSHTCIPNDIVLFLRENKFDDHFVRFLMRRNDEGASFAELAGIVRTNWRGKNKSTHEQNEELE